MNSQAYTEAWNHGYTAALDDLWAIAETLIDEEFSTDSDLLTNFIDALQMRI